MDGERGGWVKLGVGVWYWGRGVNLYIRVSCQNLGKRIETRSSPGERTTEVCRGAHLDVFSDGWGERWPPIEYVNGGDETSANVFYFYFTDHTGV